MSSPNDFPQSAQASWRGFVEDLEPLRPELYRYCRHLTRSPWDAEDLAQDTLGRAFVTLAQMGEAPANPRAWLFRVASNLWIDRVRRGRHEAPLAEANVGGPRLLSQSALAGPPESSSTDLRSTREAAGTLLGQLAPQERAAVLLKDVFDLSLDEVAEALSTTVGAVKAALHRARGKLVEPPTDSAIEPRPAQLDAFCAAFNAGDIERLTALLLDSASVEVVGATTQYGKEAARRTVLYGMLFGVQRVASMDICGIDLGCYKGLLANAPRVEAREHRGAWVLIHWYEHVEGEAVRALTRIQSTADGVSRLQNYFFTPDLISEVCAELGLPCRSNGYRWCLPNS